jgi:hydroxypyruvate reductase
LQDPNRSALLEIYQQALQAVGGRQAVATYLKHHPLSGRVRLIAVGKAAQSMADGAWEVLGDAIDQALIVSKYGHIDREICHKRGWEAVESGHPLPDLASLHAGQRLLELLREDDPASLLFLISGGASSLLECPVSGVDPGFLRHVNDWLLSSGLGIEAMNWVRKGLSRIKGGGLLQWLGDKPVCALAISDVPGDDPAIIGSGLLVPDASLQAGLRRLRLPEWLAGPVFEGLEQRRTAPPQAPQVVLVANLGLAKQAAARQARALGYAVREEDEFIAGDAAQQGRRLANALLQGDPGVTIWGGETTVRLPPSPGRGGRNQHLALAAAEVLQGHDGVWLLAAGTDGTDGPTEDAGALVDGATGERAATEGMDLEQSLDLADAGSLLEATGDLITTGPTGTGVMDLMIGLKL